ncbi:MAG: hypothetical protein WDO17_27590 [Alphaproteobacteria bacterium]
MSSNGADKLEAGHVQAWLLSFLRFAVTRDEADRSAFLARARELDRGGHLATPAFSFFCRTGDELCDALLTPDDSQSRARLDTFLKRIGDDRLRRTLKTALGFEAAQAVRREIRAHRRDYLWQGLAVPSTRRA